MSDEPLLLAIGQAIDALTFTQTHEIDSDFRAHSRATMSTLRPLQAEQRNRIDQAYGARPPSPDFLATQLLATYRGEAASVQLAKESPDSNSAPTAITAMSNAQCRSFKKDMKQRIHEWEGAVRDATGQAEVLAEQKAPLRSIYELYKASKNKVVGTESVARGQSNRSSTVAVEPSQPMSHSVRTSTIAGDDNAAGGGSRAGSTTIPVAAASTASRLSTSSVLRTSASSEVPHARTAASSSAGAPSTYDRAEVVGSKIPRIPIGTAPVETLSMSDLQSEKRKLKQVLHRFESDFAALYGEPPSRRDRRSFSAEYHRYGLLKTELAKRESAAK